MDQKRAIEALLALPLLDQHQVPEQVNGLPVVATVPLPYRQQGELPLAVVICHDPTRETAGVPWVTWYWVQNEEEERPDFKYGHATEGGYHHNYSDALSDLADRARRYSETSTGKRF